MTPIAPPTLRPPSWCLMFRPTPAYNASVTTAARSPSVRPSALCASQSLLKPALNSRLIAVEAASASSSGLFPYSLRTVAMSPRASREPASSDPCHEAITRSRANASRGLHLSSVFTLHFPSDRLQSSVELHPRRGYRVSSTIDHSTNDGIHWGLSSIVLSQITGS